MIFLVGQSNQYDASGVAAMNAHGNNLFGGMPHQTQGQMSNLGGPMGMQGIKSDQDNTQQNAGDGSNNNPGRPIGL